VTVGFGETGIPGNSGRLLCYGSYNSNPPVGIIDIDLTYIHSTLLKSNPYGMHLHSVMSGTGSSNVTPGINIFSEVTPSDSSSKCYAAKFKVNDSTYLTGAPLIIEPSSSAAAPTHSAFKGALWVTSAGVLYINSSGSTTWTKVGAQ
jgi:hypothetical protein